MGRLLWMVCWVWAEFAAANIPAHRPVSGALPAPASSVTVNGQSAERYGDFTFARTNLSLTGNDTFTVIAQNQFGSATNSATYSLPASVTLKWDLNGNLTNDGTRSFFYDAQNRLTNVTVETKWKVEFVHDGLGRRRIMSEYGWQGGQWLKTNEVRYVCDAMLPVQERDGNNIVRLSYTRGPDLSGSLQGAGGIGGLLARTDSAGNSLFYHADGAGNVTALMDMAGNVAGRYQYGPFGRLSGMWGPMAAVNVMRFSSMPHHGNSGLSLYASRAYDPHLQRWLSADPIGEAGGINLFGFVHNNPLSYVDPWGEQFFLGPPQSGMAEHVQNIPGTANPSGVAGSYVDALLNSLSGFIALTMRNPYDWREQQILDRAKQIAQQELGSPMMKRGKYEPGSGEQYVGEGLALATTLAVMKGWPRPVQCAAKNPARILGKGVPDPSGATFRMGRFDPKTGQTVFDDIGHFGQDVKGLSLLEKEGKVFWANDSISSPKILTPDEIRAVESSLREAFPNSVIEQVQKITDAFGK